MDYIVLKETASYLRGAEPLELPFLTKKDLEKKGFDLANTYISCGELEGVEYIVERLQDNDVAILCCQAEVEVVIDYFEKLCK